MGFKINRRRVNGATGGRDNYEIRARPPMEGKARKLEKVHAIGRSASGGNKRVGAQSLPAYGGAEGDQGLSLLIHFVYFACFVVST